MYSSAVTPARQSIKILFILTLISLFPLLSKAESFKFKIKNTTQNWLTVFYKISEKSGNFKVKTLIKLKAGEERIKDVSVGKGDTVSFYGQNAEDETSVIIRKNFAALKSRKDQIFYIPIIIPQKENASFESLANLSLKLEHNKVLNFLLKMDSTSMTSLSLLENNFQNVYPLGTFLFVDTKTNRLLLPPLEPSFWNSSENYLTIQDSLYALVDNTQQAQAGVQVANFVAKLFDSLRVNNTQEIEFKGQLSLLRWKPTAAANIYQIFNDKSVEAFLQNCYEQIDNPDVEYNRYRLYFLSSYERIDNLEISGKQFYNFGNEADLSLATNPGFQILSTNMGIMYTKNKTLSNYYSVQNAILRTKAFDFTSLLFNGFKASVKNSIIADAYDTQHRIQFAIIDEYRNLVDYNPDPVRLSLSKLADKDTTFSLTPIITTIDDLTPYSPKAPDTTKAALLTNKNDLVEGYNNKVRLFNSHLKEINSLVKQLEQTNADITKLLASRNDSKYPASSSNANGMLSEIVVSNKIVRKE
jgi:hypothetical protein